MVKENRKLKNIELNRKSIDDFKNSEKMPVVVVLDNIRSLNNIGSVFRTSDAMLVQQIVLCGISGTPPHKEIYRTALGAENSVAWEYHTSTLEAISKLKSDDYIIISLEQTESSENLADFQPVVGKRYAFVFGNELRGVDQDVVNQSDKCIEIPQFGTKHSFNIAVSVGIVLWDYYIKVRPMNNH